MRVPPAVAELADRLRDNGAQTRTVSYDRPDNRVVDFTWPRRPVAVRIIADQGLWVVEVGRLDWEEFFDVEVWDSYFTGRPEPLPDRPLTDQAAWVTDAHLDRIARCADQAAVDAIRARRLPRPGQA